MRRFSFTASSMAAVLAVALACAPSAAAAGPPMTVSVRQASGGIGNYFQVSAQSGQVVSAGTLRLRNQTDDPVTVYLDPVRGMTASTLGSAYKLRGSKASGPASWVVLDERRVVLAPRGHARLPVSVRMGVGTRPGDYLAGIGVQAGGASSVRASGNVEIGSVQRYAIGVVVRVPGPRNPLVKLTGVGLDREPAGVTFKIKGRNSGNVILQNVQGLATISNGNHVVARRKMGPGTFVTGTSIAYPILVSKLRPKMGTQYRVRAYLRYPGGIAKIDKVVEFGEIDAMRQQAYGGPKVDGGGDDNQLLLFLLIAAAIAGGLAALQWRRRRPSSGEGALRRALPRQIAHARANGEPLSLTVVRNGRAGSRDLATAARACLRPRDEIFQLEQGGLMVVSPDTTPEAGEVLAAEIRRRLSRGGNGAPALILIPNAAASNAEELLQAVSAGASGSSSQVGAGNGSRQGDGTQDAIPSEVKHSGTEAPAVGTPDGTHRG
jgi:hypothetical protein